MCALCLRYTAANGKPPKLAKTPCVSSPSYAPDEQQPLSDSLFAEYRSLVGIAMYMAQERFDIQYATKTLASSLKNPTRKSWLELGRLIGYLRFSENFALRMNKINVRKDAASWKACLEWMVSVLKTIWKSLQTVIGQVQVT